MHHNPYASLAPRFQRPSCETTQGNSRESQTAAGGFKRAEGGFKRAEGGFKRADDSRGFKRADDSRGFKRADDSRGFKREEGVRPSLRVAEVPVFNAHSASAFPALGGQEEEPKPHKAPIWVKGQDTAKVIERALQVKTPPPVARIIEKFIPLDGYASCEDIPTFEEVCNGSWDD